MTAAQNAAVIRAGYAAFAAGDLAAVRRLFTPDIQWHVPGHGALAKTYSGREEVFGYFAKLNELTGGTFSVEVRDVPAPDDHVVLALVRESAQRGTDRLDEPEAHEWRMRDGLAAEFWPYRSDGAAVDAFWS